MNTFNRIVIILALLAMMVVATGILLAPQIVLMRAGEWLQYGGEYFDQFNKVGRIAGGLVLAVIVDAILALLIFFEARPQRKRFIRVQQVAGGMVTINDTSIVQQLEYKLDPVPGVINVKPQIHAKRDKVQATVNVEVSANVNVPQMAAQLMEKVQSVLTEDLGLQVYGKPEVRIKVAPTPGGAIPPAPTPRYSAPPALPVQSSRNEERRPIPESERAEALED